MKDLKDMEAVVEAEEDTEEDKLVEEDQFIATILISKDTWTKHFHFQEDLGVHIARITPMLPNIVQTLLKNGKIMPGREVPNINIVTRGGVNTGTGA